MPSHRRPARASAVRRADVFVDSSAWIAFFSARDQNHGAADAMLHRAAETRARLFTTNLVLAEVHRLLLFRAGIPAALAAVDRIAGSSLVSIVYPDADSHRAARSWLIKLSDQVITYADAVSFAVMQAVGCRCVMTFDSDFWIAGFEPWAT